MRHGQTQGERLMSSLSPVNEQVAWSKALVFWPTIQQSLFLVIGGTRALRIRHPAVSLSAELGRSQSNRPSDPN